MSKVRLKQLAQDGATAGQVPTWNNVTGLWEPAAASGGAVSPSLKLGTWNYVNTGFASAAGSFSTFFLKLMSVTPVVATNQVTPLTAMITKLGAGNVLRVHQSSDPSKWWLVTIISAAPYLTTAAQFQWKCEVSSDATNVFDDTNLINATDYDFYLDNVAGSRTQDFAHVYTATLSTQNNWYTYDAANGWNSPGLNLSLVTTAAASAIGASLPSPWIGPSPSKDIITPPSVVLAGVELGGRCVSGSVTVETAYYVRNNVTGVATIQFSNSNFVLPTTWGSRLMVNTVMTDINGRDLCGICIRRTSATQSNVTLQVTLRYAVGV